MGFAVHIELVRYRIMATFWGDGEDLVALTELPELATEGNAAAQIFLGRLEYATHTQTHVTADMTRAARIRLRGLSGTNWRRVAGKTTPLAQAF